MTLGLLAVDSTPALQHERFATDWTARSPGGRLSPVDDRALGVTIAGFPYGETLHVSAIATVVTPSKQPQLPALSVSTGSADSHGP
jgi:hypothetical protein